MLMSVVNFGAGIPMCEEGSGSSTFDFIGRPY